MVFFTLKLANWKNGTGYGLDCEGFSLLAKVQGATIHELELLDKICKPCEIVKDDDKYHIFIRIQCR